MSTHDAAIKKNTQKKEDDEKRIRRLEEKMQNIDQNTIDIRQCNIVAKEVREMERRERNIVIFNVPESREEGEEDAKRLDMVKTQGILKELGFDEIQPTNVSRTGKSGKFPKQTLVTLKTGEDCAKIMKKCRDEATLSNGIFITRDRTYNQRQEAKIFRAEKEKEEKDGSEIPPGRGRGGGRPRGCPQGRGGAGRGRGRGGGGMDSESRKRQHSGDERNVEENDEESKRQRIAGKGIATNNKDNGTPDPIRTTKPVSDHSSTTRPRRDSELGAVGG